MREGPQLRVAKVARAPPCTLPILGRCFFFFPHFTPILFFLPSRYIHIYNH